MEYHKNFSLEPLFYINEEGLVCQEEFRDVPGYEGLYQASNLGRVKSLERICKNRFGYRNKPESIMKQFVYNKKYKYLKVNLTKEKKSKIMQIHKIVMMAFSNHNPDGTNKIVVDHVNKTGNDNILQNLQLLTNRENISKDTNNSTGFHNIFSKDKKRFRVCISLNKKRLHFGVYDKIEDALYIRDKVLLLIKNKKDISEFIKDKKDAIQPKRKIKETEYDKIKILYNEGCSVINIAKKYNVERTVIYKILKATI
jgi:hypothetical protein